MTHTEGEDEPTETSLSVDAILDLLAHHHRREILRVCRDVAENTVPEDEIIGRLVEQDGERRGEQPGWDHISAALHHIHEPKLSEAGVLAYHESKELYEYEPHDDLEEWLDHVDSLHGPDA